MREVDRWRSEVRPLDRRHGRWPGGRPCVWFYDPEGRLPVSLCPLIIRLDGGAIGCFEPLRVDWDEILSAVAPDRGRDEGCGCLLRVQVSHGAGLPSVRHQPLLEACPTLAELGCPDLR